MSSHRGTLKHMCGNATRILRLQIARFLCCVRMRARVWNHDVRIVSEINRNKILKLYRNKDEKN